MELRPYVPIGRVVKTHGLKGEVAVAPASDLPFAFPVGLQVWLVPPVSGVGEVRIESASYGPRLPLVTLSGITGIDAAKRIVGREILARTEDLPSEWLEDDGEPDILGYSVFDDVRGFLGEVDEVIVTGANDVWVVEGPFGQVLLPVIDDVVKLVDDDARRVDVHLLPGLLDEGEE